MTRVLVFGRSPDLMAVALRTLAAEGIAAEGALSAAEAIARLAAGGIALVAIGGGVGPEDRRAVRAAARPVPCIDIHGPDNLVPAVRASLAERPPP